MKSFLATKSKGYFVYFGSTLCGLLAGIIWAARGGDILTDANPVVLILSLIGAVVGVLCLWKDFSPLEMLPFALFFFAFARFYGDEFTFIGNVFVGVDGNHFDAAFIIGTIFSLLGWIGGFVACLMGLEKEEKMAKQATI